MLSASLSWHLLFGLVLDAKERRPDDRDHESSLDFHRFQERGIKMPNLKRTERTRVRRKVRWTDDRDDSDIIVAAIPQLRYDKPLPPPPSSHGRILQEYDEFKSLDDLKGFEETDDDVQEHDFDDPKDGATATLARARLVVPIISIDTSALSCASISLASSSSSRSPSSPRFKYSAPASGPAARKPAKGPALLHPQGNAGADVSSLPVQQSRTRSGAPISPSGPVISTSRIPRTESRQRHEQRFATQSNTRALIASLVHLMNATNAEMDVELRRVRADIRDMKKTMHCMRRDERRIKKHM